MDLSDKATLESPRDIDFDIHGVVRIRLINPSPSDLDAACRLLGSPSRWPSTDADVTVRFVDDLLVCGMSLLGPEEGFTDEGFYLLEKGTRRVKARIPFDQIGGPCEIVCRRRMGSVPLLIPIVGLTALKRECIPVHASAVVYDGTGLLMAGWAHCGKTTALLGFASKGAEFVGEECVFLDGNEQSMYGIVRPLELTHGHVASLPRLRGTMNLMRRCAFRGISALRVLQKMIPSESIRSTFVFRNLQRACTAVNERFRLAIAPSAIFQDRIRCTGTQADKIFLFVSQEGHRIEVEPIRPSEMACRLTFLVQHELSPLLQHYAAYRFAFPRGTNELIESVAESSLAILTRALHGKETYIVRLPYPHAFPELFKALEPNCKRRSARAVESMHQLV